MRRNFTPVHSRRCARFGWAVLTACSESVNGKLTGLRRGACGIESARVCDRITTMFDATRCHGTDPGGVCNRARLVESCAQHRRRSRTGRQPKHHSGVWSVGPGRRSHSGTTTIITEPFAVGRRMCALEHALLVATPRFPCIAFLVVGGVISAMCSTTSPVCTLFAEDCSRAAAVGEDCRHRCGCRAASQAHACAPCGFRQSACAPAFVVCAMS